MKPTEDRPTPADVAATDATARQALVRAAALAAVVNSGCKQYPELYSGHIEARLAAISPGDGAPMRVYAVDATGAVREGAHGPMTADDVVAEVRAEHPEWNRLGWL